MSPYWQNNIWVYNTHMRKHLLNLTAMWNSKGAPDAQVDNQCPKKGGKVKALKFKSLFDSGYIIKNKTSAYRPPTRLPRGESHSHFQEFFPIFLSTSIHQYVVSWDEDRSSVAYQWLKQSSSLYRTLCMLDGYGEYQSLSCMLPLKPQRTGAEEMGSFEK